MLNHSSSPCRTAGPIGCRAAVSGRMMWSALSASSCRASASDGNVRRQHHATLVGVGHDRVGPLCEFHQLEGHLEAGEIIDDALLVGGFRRDANARARQLQRAGDVLRLAHHEALSVIDQHAGKADAEGGVAARRHRRCCATARRSRPTAAPRTRRSAGSSRNFTASLVPMTPAASALQKSTLMPDQTPCALTEE